jgi:hypothetical protein
MMLIGLHSDTRRLQQEMRAAGLLKRVPPPVLEAVLWAHSSLAEKSRGGRFAVHPGAQELADGFMLLLTELRNLRAARKKSGA